VFVCGTREGERTPHEVVVRVAGRDSVRKGEVIHVTTDPRSVHVFDTESGERLSARPAGMGARS
jgi:multiple sugar transport system ATP-binding protein